MINQLRNTVQKYDAARAKVLKKFDLTNPQFDVLAFLAANGAHPVGKVAEGLGCSRGNMTGITDRLEQDGVISRVRSNADRRVVDAALTTKGATIYHEASAAIERLNYTLDGTIPPGVHDVVADAMRTLDAAIKTA